MGWEQRKGEGRYYVQKKREGKRVRSVYVGANEVGELAAEFDAYDSQVTQQQRQAVRELNAQLQAHDVPLRAFSQAVDALAAVVKLLNGYHQHKGQWRKKRMGKEESEQPRQEHVNLVQAVINTGEREALASPGGPEAVRELLRKGASKHPEVCKALWALLDADGRGALMVQDLTSTANQVLQLEPNLTYREAFTRQMQLLREELGWHMSPALERLLIERIVLAWYTLHKVEMEMARLSAQESYRMVEAEFVDARTERATKRYLAAIKALADVRKLNLNVQVNIGEKQINVQS